MSYHTQIINSRVFLQSYNPVSCRHTKTTGVVTMKKKGLLILAMALLLFPAIAQGTAQVVQLKFTYNYTGITQGINLNFYNGTTLVGTVYAATYPTSATISTIVYDGNNYFTITASGMVNGKMVESAASQPFLVVWPEPVAPPPAVYANIPFSGNWNGDGKSEMTIVRDGIWYRDIDGNGIWNPTTEPPIKYGGYPQDIYLTGDWNGDGKSEMTIVRDGIWYRDIDGNGIWNPTTEPPIKY